MNCGLFLFILFHVFLFEKGIGVEEVQIPIFDAYGLFKSNSYNDDIILQQMDNAAQQYGVFLLTNISKNILQFPPHTIHQTAKKLFSLDDELKRRLSFNSTHHFGRGYLSFGAESGLSEFFEPKEGYSYGYPYLHDEAKQYGWLTSPNRWPNEFLLPEREILESVPTTFGSLAKQIILSLLQYRLEKFNQSIELSIEDGEKISLMRLFHYFVVASSTQEEEFQRTKKQYLGSSPHTDWGLLTIILQNEISGLQFYYQDRWIDVPNIPDTLIINIGDYFALASQGVYHSPIHRVLCPTEYNRLSFVYFYYPNYESRLIQSTMVDDALIEPTLLCDLEDKNLCSPPNGHILGAKNMQFNSLTTSEDHASDYSSDSLRGNTSFGDYILYKWKSVLRTQV